MSGVVLKKFNEQSRVVKVAEVAGLIYILLEIVSLSKELFIVG
jgi:hypothetical protein